MRWGHHRAESRSPLHKEAKMGAFGLRETPFSMSLYFHVGIKTSSKELPSVDKTKTPV